MVRDNSYVDLSHARYAAAIYNVMYLYAALGCDDTMSSNAPPPRTPSGSALNNNNSVIAGTVGFLLALVVVIPLVTVGVTLLCLMYTGRIVIGKPRQAHNQTENTTGIVEEHRMTETVSLYN